ncbi:MAG: hydantoinase/oxoprolinase family protein, partial [Geminicoccaceae bacterium]|nr:hydantoinase/oxoprolinase family protein [Geminicoccaceae bacterium]
LTIAVDDIGIGREALHAAFEAAYWNRFAVELPEIRPVLVNLHSAVIGRRPSVALESFAERPDRGEPLSESRPVRFGSGWTPTPVLERSRLAEGERIEGPAVIRQLDATTLIEPGDRAEIDRFGNLVIGIAR